MGREGGGACPDCHVDREGDSTGPVQAVRGEREVPLLARPIVSEYIWSSPLVFLDNLRFFVGFISASTALKMGDASQLYYTDVAVITVYILYISRLLRQRKRKYSQDVNEAVGCARVVPPYGQLAEGLGNLWKGLAAREA
ncbi:hypothetical protein TURU_033917 [Turdus rufiventris]|nr:hypothetical protein TURU_033917 [Turdus rufiventris]